MVTCSIFGREVELQGSPITLIEYYKEFGGDLMQDLIKAYSQGFVNSAIILQIAWAMAKTANQKTKTFKDWMAEFDAEQFNLMNADFVEVVDSAINAELFCGNATNKKRRCRRFIARLLERLSKCFSNLATRLFV